MALGADIPVTADRREQRAVPVDQAEIIGEGIDGKGIDLITGQFDGFFDASVHFPVNVQDIPV